MEFVDYAYALRIAYNSPLVYFYVPGSVITLIQFGSRLLYQSLLHFGDAPCRNDARLLVAPNLLPLSSVLFRQQDYLMRDCPQVRRVSLREDAP